jgi:hypothetical protein
VEPIAWQWYIHGMNAVGSGYSRRGLSRPIAQQGERTSGFSIASSPHRGRIGASGATKPAVRSGRKSKLEWRWRKHEVSSGHAKPCAMEEVPSTRPHDTVFKRSHAYTVWRNRKTVQREIWNEVGLVSEQVLLATNPYFASRP